VIGDAVHIMRIAPREIEPEADGKVMAAARSLDGRRGSRGEAEQEVSR
jgi:hypothetical protein